MSSPDAESIATRYVRTIGRTAGERYQFDFDHLVWLLGHCTRLRAPPGLAIILVQL